MKKVFVSILCCTCILTACTKVQESVNTGTSQSSQTSASQQKSTGTSETKNSGQSASSSSNTNSSTSTTPESSSQIAASSEEQVASSNSESKAIEPQTAMDTAQSTVLSSTTIDIDAISNGDYSSIAGTWANSRGEVLIIENDGKARFSESTEDSILSVQSVKNQVIHADIATGPYSAAMKIIPAGEEDPYYATVENVDRIAIGHSIDMYEHPFYRQ
ncbi:TPA: hypothetical protein U1D18_001608 [Streptococcus suis]|nr:hypothetical protein [Streptococcus suis]HEM3717897.1 hypothetical protein [Streptococcus suis]